MTDGRIVACVKWGSAYGPAYVNALVRGARRYLSAPTRFVCLTDDATGLDPAVEVRDLSALRAEMPPERVARGKWQKLTMFRRGVFPDDAAVLFLDLDTVIVGDLDALFARVEAVGGHSVCLHDGPRWAGDPPHRFGNSSVVGFVPREQHHIYDRFVADGASPPVGKEQEFQSVTAHDVKHWPAGWIANFKSDCARAFPTSLFFHPRLPSAARVVMFPGAIKPIELSRQGLYVWGTPARWGIGAVPWIRDYWRGVGADAAGAPS